MSNPLTPLLTALSVVFSALSFVVALWWLYLPIILLVFTWHLRIKYKRLQFIQNFDWVLLEIKPPRELIKTPRSMEQFFTGIHGIHSDPNWAEAYLDGNVQPWFSMEMVSIGGETHFFMRTLKMFRDIVEANIYAQYPESEIAQVNDYVHNIPPYDPGGDFDIWGSELVLVKEDAYPIRTYVDFSHDVNLEEQRVDPVASLLEVMTKISNKEHIWLQTLIRPVGPEWKEAGEKLRDKLIGRESAPKGNFLGTEVQVFMHELRSLIHAMFFGEELEPYEESAVDDKKSSALWWMTKGEGDVVKAIEDNISKIGFETIIRFIYMGKKDVFSKANVGAVIGTYKQFGTQHLNAFKPSAETKTSAVDYKWQGKDMRTTYRKRRVLADYKKRDFVQHSSCLSYLNPLIFERLPILNWFFMRSKPFILNVEELATVYHFPSLVVKAPLTPRVEAKKGEPPAGLPVG